MSIIIRPIAISDLPIIFEQMSDPESSTMAAVPARDKVAFDAHWAKIMANEHIILRTIEVDGQVAGHLVSFMIGEERQIGYWLGKEFWGKGIASESLRQFLDVVKTRPLFGRVAKHNGASRRVLEKCGFKFHGEEKYLNKDNKEVEGFILKLEA
jgi:RimJ/RimL family protein N-acetyltransferase